MTIKTKIRKLLTPLFIASLSLSLVMPSYTYANSLTRPIARCHDCASTCRCKCFNPCVCKHKKVKHHYKRSCRSNCYAPRIITRHRCISCNYYSRDFVEFKSGRAPCGNYVDLYDDYYAPDMRTADDNSMFYPDMNIDR